MPISLPRGEVCTADMRIVFDLPVADRYDAAIRLLGIEPSALFGSAGHA